MSDLRYGVADSIVGKSGSMPIDYLLRKQQQTCIYESPYMVEDYQRGLLRDFKPDTPFFASDQPRGGVDKNGTPRGGYQSTATINLRSGARTLTDSYLPEGTFLDYQFTEKDPRGVALDPDYRKGVDQQYSRKDLYNYRDDSDNSVPEQGVNPWVMQSNIRNSQVSTKEYLRIFSTEFDNFTNGIIGPGFNPPVSVAENVQDDQVIKDPAHAPNRTRMDVTNNLSNDTSIGWRRTTDHRFKVEKYGRNTAKKPITEADTWKNRGNAHIDHDTLVSWEDTNMRKAMALLMMDLTKQKEMYQFTGLNGIIFGNSEKTENKKRKLTPADMAGVVNRPTKESQPSTPHTQIKGEMKPVSGERLMIHDVKNIEKSYINPTIVEKMSNVNRQTKKEQKDDLRTSIKKSADDYGIYMEDDTKKTVKDFDPAAIWNSISMYKKGESMNVKNYKAAVTTIEEGGTKLNKISKAIDFKESKGNEQRRGKLNSDNNANMKKARLDNDYGREVERAHLVGPLGSKYLNSYMDRDSEFNDINDRDDGRISKFKPHSNKKTSHLTQR